MEIKRLIASGVIVNATNKKGFTALHVVTAKGHADLVDVLVQAKANVDSFNIFLQGPIHLAVLGQCTNVISLLVRAKVNINAKDCDGLSAIELATSSECIAALFSLMHAASKRDDKAVSLLLKSGYNPLVQDRFGDTALHKAAVHDDTGLVVLLIQGRAEVRATISHKQGSANAASHSCIERKFQRDRPSFDSQSGYCCP